MHTLDANHFASRNDAFTDNPATSTIKPMLIVHFDEVTTQKVRLSLKRHPNELCQFLNLEEVQVYSKCLEGDACKTETGCANAETIPV
jgi:hypothetical protein